VILQAIAKALNIMIVPEGGNLLSMVFKDSNGCFMLAAAPKMTPCTKHIGIK
jgi:hypothetical protein